MKKILLLLLMNVPVVHTMRPVHEFDLTIAIHQLDYDQVWDFLYNQPFNQSQIKTALEIAQDYRKYLELYNQTKLIHDLDRIINLLKVNIPFYELESK